MGLRKVIRESRYHLKNFAPDNTNMVGDVAKNKFQREETEEFTINTPQNTFIEVASFANVDNLGAGKKLEGKKYKHMFRDAR